MAASLAQIIANRLNALRSTGPKTDEGKARSRRNATTHGLSRLGVVPPEFMADVIADRRLSWRDSYQPADSTQEWFFGRLCAESVRVDFCDARIVSARAEQAERASESWDDDRALDASKLGARLSKQPEIIQQTLLQSRHGVLWLLDRWEEVSHEIRAINGWTPGLWDLAMDLLGLPIAARQGTGPWSLDDADPGPEPGLLLVREATDALRSRLTDTLNARDSRARLDAELGLSTDEPPPLRLLHRYAADARRQVFRNLAELIRLQRLDSRVSSASSAVPAVGPPGPRPARPGKGTRSGADDSCESSLDTGAEASRASSPRSRAEDSPSSLDAEVDAMVDSLLAQFRPRHLSRFRDSGSGAASPNSPAEATPSTSSTLADRSASSPPIATASKPDHPSSSLSPDGSRPPGSSPTLSPSTRPTLAPSPTSGSSPRPAPGTSPASGSPTRSTPGVSLSSGRSTRSASGVPTASEPVAEPTAAPARSSNPSAAMSPAQVVAARFSSSASHPSPSPDSSSNEAANRSASTSTSMSPSPSKAARSTGLVASIRAKLNADRPLANRRSRRAQAAAARRS